MFHEKEMFHKYFLEEWEMRIERGREGLEKYDNLMKPESVIEMAAGRCLPCSGILAAAKERAGPVKNKRIEQGVCLVVFGLPDQKILACYRIFWGSVRNTKDSGVMLRRMMAECMEETLFRQYESGMALLCLIAEGLPGSWQPGSTVKRGVKDKVRPLITRVEGKGGAGSMMGGG